MKTWLTNIKSNLDKFKNWLKAFKITFMYANILLLLVLISNGIVMYTTDKILSRTILSALNIINMEPNDELRYKMATSYLKDLGDAYYIVFDKNNQIKKANIEPDIYETELTNDKLRKCIFINDDLYFQTKHGKIVLYIPVLSTNKEYIIIMGIFYILFILAITNILNKLVFNERNSYLEVITSKERVLHREILTNIALNINHEMNSPLLVIKSIFDEIRYTLHEEMNKEKKCPMMSEPCLKSFLSTMDDVLDDISLGEDSLESIYSIIRPLGDYKSIEYSNGNKNFYMLIESSVNMVKYSKSYLINNVYIDEELEKYSLYHDNGMSNGTFLTIIINHIKNSMEANASKLKFFIVDKNETHLFIAIEDDGNGIPKEVRENIFKVNITTKADISKYERGVGMYINKVLLKEKYEGDVWLDHTEVNQGTTFILKVRYEPFKYYNDGVNHTKK